MKQLFFSLLTLACISATISCKKEVTTEPKASNIASTISSSDIITTDSVNFGALIDASTSDQRIIVANKFGVHYMRATIFLSQFKGKDAGVEKYMNSGFKVILNINYDNVLERDGKKIPVPFPTNMSTYRTKLGAVLDKYKPEVAVIENEPTTDAFHSGPIENYITELANAIDVCHSKGVKVADGCVHVDYVKTIMNGATRLSGNALEVKKLIEAYKTLNLDFVNVHTHGDNDSYPDGLLANVADYLRTQTGHPVMCNEFTVHSTSTSLITSMVNGFKAGKYKYVLVRSGNSSAGAKPLHSGTGLLPNGITYRDDVKN
jgi:hypothetical protein